MDDIILSFLIVTYKRNHILQKCLKRIFDQVDLPRPFEIIIVDNDGAANIPETDDPGIDIRLFRMNKNTWVTGGRNFAFAKARGKYMVIIDDDAILRENDAISKMLKIMQDDKQCGAVTIRSLAPNGSIHVGELPHPDKQLLLEAKKPLEIPYFYTMCAMCRSEVVKDIGGYPERYKIYAEEFDLSYQMIDRGFHIIYDPNLAVFHHHDEGGRTVRGPDVWRKGAVNKSQVAWRMLPFHYAVTTTFVWSVAVLLKTRSIGQLLAMWKEIWSYRSELKRERNVIKHDRLKYIQSVGGRLLY